VFPGLEENSIYCKSQGSVGGVSAAVVVVKGSQPGGGGLLCLNVSSRGFPDCKLALREWVGLLGSKSSRLRMASSKRILDGGDTHAASGDCFVGESSFIFIFYFYFFPSGSGLVGRNKRSVLEAELSLS